MSTQFNRGELEVLAFNGETHTERALARMLLAGMDSEPVAYMIGGHYLMHAHDPKVDNYASAVPLYAAPPAPVAVPDDVFNEAWEQHLSGVMCGDNNKQATLSFLNDCRAAMLKAGRVTAAAWIAEAKKLAEMYGISFVVFRNGEEPQCADPTKVVISFTDKGLGYPAAPEQEV